MKTKIFFILSMTLSFVATSKPMLQDSSITDTLLPLYPGAKLRVKVVDGGYFVDRVRMTLVQELFGVFHEENTKLKSMTQNLYTIEGDRASMLELCEKRAKMYEDLVKAKDLEWALNKELLLKEKRGAEKKAKRAKRLSWLWSGMGFIAGAAATTYFFLKIW